MTSVPSLTVSQIPVDVPRKYKQSNKLSKQQLNQTVTHCNLAYGQSAYSLLVFNLQLVTR